VARCPLGRCVRRVDFQAAMTSLIVKGRYLPAPENSTLVLAQVMIMGTLDKIQTYL
jgi:hypothetical protein